MPVVIVSAPRHDAAPALLTAVADAVADALGLAAGDVLASQVETSGIVSNHGATPEGAWPIVSIHGGDRGEEAQSRALTQAETAVRAWADGVGFVLGGVWSEWIPPKGRQ